MKKVLALLMAMMLLLGMTAMAEEAQLPALITTISNVELSMASGGETKTASLDDLTIVNAIDTTDVPQATIEAITSEGSLCFAIARLTADGVCYTVEGMDKTYVAEIPQLAGMDPAELAGSLRSALPQLLALKLPQIGGVTIPKADISILTQLFPSDTDENGFAIPAEMTKLLLDQLTQSLESTADSIPNGDQILGLLKQLTDNGLEISLAGTVNDTDARQTANLDVYLSSENQPADTPMISLSMDSVENQFQLLVSAMGMNLGSLDLESEPAENEIMLQVNIMDSVLFDVNIFRDSDLQCASLSIKASDQQVMGLDMSWGVLNDHDYTSLILSSADQGTISASSESVQTEDGSEQGALYFSADMNGEQFVVTGEYVSTLGNYDLGDYAMPTETVPASEFNSEEAQAALQPLVEYLNGITAQIAA